MSAFLGFGDALISAVVFGVSQWMGYFDWRSYFKEHNWRRTMQMGTLFGLLMQGLGIFYQPSLLQAQRRAANRRLQVPQRESSHKHHLAAVHLVLRRIPGGALLQGLSIQQGKRARRRQTVGGVRSCCVQFGGLRCRPQVPRLHRRRLNVHHRPHVLLPLREQRQEHRIRHGGPWVPRHRGRRP